LSTSKLSPKEIRLLLSLAAINFTHIMDFMIMMPMGDQLMKKLSINPQQFSLLVASYTIAAGVASFTGTFFVDRFDRKKVLLTMQVLSSEQPFAVSLPITIFFWLPES
jgi:predicted MFS family arabinose efflux permease